MKMNREELLSTLSAVSSGLDAKQEVDQSGCFAFVGGEVITYNDEVFCSAPLDAGFEGVIPSAPLLGLLGKLSASEVDASMKDGSLEVRSGKGLARIKVESEVRLPVGAMERPEKWAKLPEGFEAALGVVMPCAGSDASKFLMTCVNLAPGWVEASDNYQICRHPMETGLAAPTVVKRDTLKAVLGKGASRMSETENWLHFRGKGKVSMSCRRYMDEYPSGTVTDVLARPKGAKVELPQGLRAALDKCKVFSDKSEGGTVEVRLKPGAMRLDGRGAYGSYSEVLEAGYSGDPIRFGISPSLLAEISSRGGKCFVSAGLVRVESGKFVYVTATQGD